MGSATRPWKSMPKLMSLPNAARISANFEIARSTSACVASSPNSSVPFILTVSKPAARTLWMDSMMSAGRSPPTQQ